MDDMPKEPVPGLPTQAADVASRAAGRRRFLTGGAAAIPTIMTLSSRPVLGNTVACQVSGALSGNQSVVMSTSCGASPGCWKNQAARNGAAAWKKAGFDPADAVLLDLTMFKASPAAPPGTPWGLTSNPSMLAALTPGTVNVTVLLTDTTANPKTVTLTIPSNGLVTQIIAGLLNAGLFKSNYGYASAAAYVSDISSRLNAGVTAAGGILSGVGATSTSNQGKVKTALDGLNTFLSNKNNLEVSC